MVTAILTSEHDGSVAQRLVSPEAAKHALEIFRIGDQGGDRNSDDPVGLPAEDFHRRGVCEADPTSPIDGENCVGRGPEYCTEGRPDGFVEGRDSWTSTR